MEIAVIGVTHHLASVETREVVSFTDSKKMATINDLLDQGIAEVVILSTCNRSEIYICSEQLDEKIAYIQSFFQKFSGISHIETYLFVKKQEAAIKHLFRVSAGLDSIVLGEDQILGQVKEAHEFAMNLGSSKKNLNRLFRQGIVTAKQIKNTTKISEQPLSISYIAVKFLRDKIGTFKNQKILVIGVGEMSSLALAYLVEEKPQAIYLANRNLTKSYQLQERYPTVQPIPYEQRYEILNQVDLVLSATAAPHVILKNEQVPNLNRNLVMMDIALPRDIDPAIGDLEGVQLYDLDILKSIQTTNEKRRQALAEVANEIIYEETITFMEWLELTSLDLTIKSLNDRCLEIQENSLNYLFKKVDLTPKEQQLVEWVMTSALKRLVREPIVNLKQIKDQGKREDYIKLIEELFNI